MINNIIYQNGVKEVFKLIVPNGNDAGEYVVEKPYGWNDIDSKISIDDEFFFIKDFIIGETEKITFMQFSHPIAFNLIKSVYEQLGGDAVIFFKYFIVDNGVETEILKDDFIVDLSKMKESYEKSKLKLEFEIKKSEKSNKLNNRFETSVNLFDEKDLDDNVITPVETIDIGYKKGEGVLTNFYTYDIAQYNQTVFASPIHFFVFRRSEGFEIGNNTNELAGSENVPGITQRVIKGPFISSEIILKLVSIRVSNLDMLCRRGDNVTPNVGLFVVIRDAGNNFLRTYLIKNSEPYTDAGTNYGRILIPTQTVEIGSLAAGERLDIELRTNDSTPFNAQVNNINTSVEITTNIKEPLSRVKSVYLKNAISQLLKSYTGTGITLKSNLIDNGGFYEKSVISTGIYLRGVPGIYVENSIKTNLKAVLQDGISKLFASGYDVINDKLVIEDLNYFFKKTESYDLSDKVYQTENYELKNDDSLISNNLLFGSTNISKDTKGDINNFVTELEAKNPLLLGDKKFDKKTSLIIDEYRIKDLIEDDSNRTKTDDDNLALIDLVFVDQYFDDAVFSNCEHSNVGGKLAIKCLLTPFDETLYQAGDFLQIKEGLNVGTWLIDSINGATIVLNINVTPQTGISDIAVTYYFTNIIKNRTSEGFTNLQNIKSTDYVTNIRHNPKFQMFRWYKFYGSGLTRKPNSEIIKVTDYKNNSLATMECNSSELNNEIQGLVVVGEDETLERLRSGDVLFTGKVMQITYNNISFFEFFNIYNNWRYGIDDDDSTNRGYLKINTPEGIIEGYPFGDNAFSHNKKTNTLTLNVRTGSKWVELPRLLTVVQDDANTISLTWDYSVDYYNPVITVYYSLDSVLWNELQSFNNVKLGSVTSVDFENILTGTEVYFKISITSDHYSNKQSNSLPLLWQFNDWILKDVSKSINGLCDYSYWNFYLQGTGDFNIDWNFISLPGGGNCVVTDGQGNIIVSFYSTVGTDYDENIITTLSLTNETYNFYLQMISTDNDGVNQLNCSGNTPVLTIAEININIEDIISGKQIDLKMRARQIKSYYVAPPEIIP